MPEDRIRSLRGKRELRQLRRGQRRGSVIAFIALATVLLALVLESGRAFRHMRRVHTFVATLATQTPDQVRAQLDGFLDLLVDRNPLVRNAAVAAFTAATELQTNGSAADWRAWWLEHRAAWRPGYTPGTNAAPPSGGPHPYRSALPPS